MSSRPAALPSRDGDAPKSARAYLDHASASPLRPGAREAMSAWLDAADPGRVHTEGRMARVALEEARERVASLFGTRSRQVIFTSGATEAINAATYGALARCASDGRGDVVLSPVEHSAVRDASERHGGTLIWVGVDSSGRIAADEVIDALSRSPALVQIQWANHEVGTIQPLGEVVGACREAGVMVHVDAAAAAGHVPIGFDSLGADLMSVSAAKLGGPRGVGALLVRRGLRVPPFIVGGMQERARRGGMENLPGSVGFGAAAEELELTLETEAARAVGQLDRLRSAALRIEGVQAFGAEDPAQRLPHLLCLGIEGVEAEPVLIGLDQAGVAVHSGSSCSSEALEPSPVLQAMGVDAERSVRVSVGWSTSDGEIDLAAAALPRVLTRLRALSGGRDEHLPT